MFYEIFLFVLAAIISFIPTVRVVTKDGANWWNKLTTAGHVYIATVIIFLIVGVILIVKNKTDEEVKELTLKKKNIYDSITHKKERLKDSIFIIGLYSKVNRLYKSDSLKTSAIKKIGYVYDSIHGLIINPRNIQLVEKGGKAFQNNGSNQGIQSTGDIYIDTNRIPDEDIKQLSSFLKSYKKRKCALVTTGMGSNSDKRVSQIKNILENNGFTIYQTFDTQLNDWKGVRMDTTQQCISFTFGTL